MEPGKLNLIKAFFKNFFSELVGTAVLVFLGCLGVSKGLGQEGDHTGVVLSFAFAVFIAVQMCSKPLQNVRFPMGVDELKNLFNVSSLEFRYSTWLHFSTLVARSDTGLGEFLIRGGNCWKFFAFFMWTMLLWDHAEKKDRKGLDITCHNSGGHVNPAVTILSLFFKRLSIPMAVTYICGQIIGGIIGFGFLKLIIPSHLFNTNDTKEFGLCSTVPNPNLTIMQAVLTEFFLTSILLLVVCSAWDPRNIHHDSLTIKFGFTIYSLAYAGVAYTGCSMNPARSFGPAIWNQTWKHHWIYWVSPLLSAVFCGFFYTNFFCPRLSPQEPTKKSEVKGDLEMNS